jgi:hypothetical protein
MVALLVSHSPCLQADGHEPNASVLLAEAVPIEEQTWLKPDPTNRQG